MKIRSIIPILCVIVIMSGCMLNESDTSVSITGSIEGLEFKGRYEKSRDTLFLDYNNIDGVRTRDPILVINGELVFKKELAIEGLTRGRIFMPMDTVTKWVVNGYYPSAVSRIDFLMYPGAKIDIRGSIKDYVDAYAYDGGVNDELAALALKTHILENEAVNAQVKISLSSYYTSPRFNDMRDEVKDSLERVYNITRLSEEEITVLEGKMEVLSKESLELKKQFIKDKPASDASPYILEGISNQLEHKEYKGLFENLSKNAKGNSFGVVIATKLTAIESTKIGNPAPAISGATVSGDDFSLEQLKGKVVLLDFWGTWCGPCMDGMPNLKMLNKKYKDELRIVGIASDREEAWRAGIKTHELDWIHLLDSKGDIALNNYNITGYPTKFILDRDGIIVFKEIGENEDSEMEKVLQELLD